MLRSILRNVQHYLLFFSILLVLLAFQRLQWVDQGILVQPGFDHPYTSPDNAGRVLLWDGESKDIGLFKFRLGLLNFALPTFAKDDSSRERTSSAFHPMMSVPLPPNKRRKSAERMYSRLKETRLQLKNKKGQGKVKPETPKASIAYVVILPQQLSSISKNIEVLPRSIRRAHTNSSYNYELYALTLNGSSTTNHIDGLSKLLREILVPDFTIINGKDTKLKTDSSLKEIDTQREDLLKLLKQHDIIVQLSPNSILLRPLENLFAVLLAAKEREPDTEMKKTDVFLLEPLGVSASEQLIIFRSDSQKISRSYIKILSCLSLIPEAHKNKKSDSHCGTLSGTSLDPCLYDAGNYSIDHNCSHVSVEDVRVARFTKTDSQKEHIQCAQPWEKLSNDNCLKNKGHQECAWLCKKWLDVSAISK